MQSVIRVETLRRDYNGLRALDGVSFTVQKGEVFGLLGPNGAGKTTTIRILTGQLRPSSGRAWVLGYDVVNQRQALKPHIGVVFEHQNLYERLSARDNLNFTANLYGVSKSRVDQVLEQVGLKDRAREDLKKRAHPRFGPEPGAGNPFLYHRFSQGWCHRLPDHPLYGGSRPALPARRHPGSRPDRCLGVTGTPEGDLRGWRRGIPGRRFRPPDRSCAGPKLSQIYIKLRS